MIKSSAFSEKNRIHAVSPCELFLIYIKYKNLCFFSLTYIKFGGCFRGATGLDCN